MNWTKVEQIKTPLSLTLSFDNSSKLGGVFPLQTGHELKAEYPAGSTVPLKDVASILKITIN